MQSKNELTTAPDDIITSVPAENGNGERRRNPLKSLSSRVTLFFGCRGCCRKKKKSRSSLGLPEGKFLLPKASKSVEDKICLVVDLDETLVHSTFKASKDADFIIPVLIEYHVHKVYVKKRPYVDHFIDTIGPLFECVLFTASLSKYADPLLNLLDKKGNFRARLFREACIFKKGLYVKNLDLLGRELSRVIILDNSPHSYLNHKQNAIPIKTWVGDPSDTELLKLLPLLKALSTCDSIYNYLPKIVTESTVNLNFQEIFSQIQEAQKQTPPPSQWQGFFR